MEANKIHSTYHCELKILSPLHIGSGKKLNRGLDFLLQGSKVLILNTEKLMKEAVQRGSKALDSLTLAIEDNDLQGWLKTNGVSVHEVAKSSYTVSDSHIREIAAHIYTGTGIPLIPGSSIKGAFRTVLLFLLDKDDGHNLVENTLKKLLKCHKINPKFADSEIISKFLGKDPKFNNMRSLLVGDFHRASGYMSLPLTYVYKLGNNKKLIRKKTYNNNYDMKIFPESLQTGSKARGQIAFDNFLTENAIDKNGFESFIRNFSLEWLLHALRLKTKKTIKYELNFFQQTSHNNTDINEVYWFYKYLSKEMVQLEENQAIFQMAWGSGWRGMTGPLLEEQDLTSQVRKKFKLAAEHTAFPFPKSRKVAITSEGARPFGWIKITFHNKEEIKKQEILEIRKREEAEKYPWRTRLEQLLKINDLILLKKKIFNDPEMRKWVEEVDEVQQAIKDKVYALVRDVAPTILNWGLLKQHFLENELVKRWAKEPSIADHVKEAALNIAKKARKRGKWTDERNELVKNFLESVGQTWDFIPGDSGVIKDYKTKDPEILEKIKSLNDWKAFKNSGLKIKELDLGCCNALMVKFKTWRIGKSKDNHKKNKFNMLQKRIKNLKTGSG